MISNILDRKFTGKYIIVNRLWTGGSVSGLAKVSGKNVTVNGVRFQQWQMQSVERIGGHYVISVNC